LLAQAKANLSKDKFVFVFDAQAGIKHAPPPAHPFVHFYNVKQHVGPEALLSSGK